MQGITGNCGECKCEALSAILKRRTGSGSLVHVKPYPISRGTIHILKRGFSTIHTFFLIFRNKTTPQIRSVPRPGQRKNKLSYLNRHACQQRLSGQYVKASRFCLSSHKLFVKKLFPKPAGRRDPSTCFQVLWVLLCPSTPSKDTDLPSSQLTTHTTPTHSSSSSKTTQI